MTPTHIHLHKKSQILDIQFGEKSYALSAEYLRTHSPSAEVKGHGGTGGATPYGKRQVQITQLEMAGNYALQIHFNDGHSSGLFRWEYLNELGLNYDKNWQLYLDKLHAMNKSREEGVSVITLEPSSASNNK